VNEQFRPGDRFYKFLSAVRLQDTGTHAATFLDVPATGRTVATEEFAFYRIVAGLIAEVWGTAFGDRLLHQIR